MMRRGALRDVPLEQVLRAMAERGATGSVRVEATVSGEVFLEGGKVTYAHLDGVSVPSALGPAREPDIGLLRDHVRTVVRALLLVRDGEYHQQAAHQTAGLVSSTHRTDYDVQRLLTDAAISASDRQALGRWTVLVRAAAGLPLGAQVDGAQWVVLRQVASPSHPLDVSERLGWPLESTVRMLDELLRLGLVEVGGRTGVPAPVAAETPPSRPVPRPTPERRPEPAHRPAPPAHAAPAPRVAAPVTEAVAPVGPVEHRAPVAPPPAPPMRPMTWPAEGDPWSGEADMRPRQLAFDRSSGSAAPSPAPSAATSPSAVPVTSPPPPPAPARAGGTGDGRRRALSRLIGSLRR